MRMSLAPCDADAENSLVSKGEPRSQAFSSHYVTPGTGCLKRALLTKEGLELLGTWSRGEREGGTSDRATFFFSR